MSDNTVKQITTDDLRRMGDREGLILQGCGGLAQEWVDGINGLFTEAGILLKGSTFQAENVSVFQNGDLTLKKNRPRRKSPRWSCWAVTAISFP